MSAHCLSRTPHAAPGSRVVFDFMHTDALAGLPRHSREGYKYAGFKVTAKVSGWVRRGRGVGWGGGGARGRLGSSESQF